MRNYLAIFFVASALMTRALAGDQPGPIHLSESIKFQTVTNSGPKEFLAFHKYLKDSFPLVHKNLILEKSGLSLLYKWVGKDLTKPAILFSAHQDVVPVDPADLSRWTEPPFSGAIKNNIIWGRGSMDDKNSLMGILEAVENLLRSHFQPVQTIYLAFGEDEESGGKGAQALASILEKNGVKIEATFDEGMVIIEDTIPGIKNAVAMIGTAEKGYFTLQLKVELAGGHSSMPASETAIGVLARAITKLETHPFPRKIGPILEEFFKVAAPSVPGMAGFAMKHLGLFGPLIKRDLEKTTAGKAILGTTTAVTIFQAGVKSNVIPNIAHAMVNFRIMPGDSVDDIISHVKTVIKDERVTIELPEGRGNPPSPISSTDSKAYKALSSAVKSVYPDVLVAPSIFLGSSDSKHYLKLSQNTYRFLPMYLKQSDLTHIHGINESLSVEKYLNVIQVYENLIKNLN